MWEKTSDCSLIYSLMMTNSRWTSVIHCRHQVLQLELHAIAMHLAVHYSGGALAMRTSALEMVIIVSGVVRRTRSASKQCLL
jgi:hypothetical protein